MKHYITTEAIKASEGHEACLKQSVYAMITTVDGTIIFGSNKMLNAVSICPRLTLGCVSGEGYHLCKEVCNQVAHAEVDAINTAISKGINIVGSKLTLVGHTYCCDYCTQTMKNHGVAVVDILGDDGQVATTLDLVA